MTAIALFMAVAVMVIMNQPPRKKIPGWVRFVFLRVLAKLVLYKTVTQSANQVGDTKKHDPMFIEDYTTQYISQMDKMLIDGMKEIRAYINYLRQKEDAMTRAQTSTSQWTDLGKVIDRLVFILHVIAILWRFITLGSVLLFEYMNTGP